jgi:hypothetical protein
MFNVVPRATIYLVSEQCVIVTLKLVTCILYYQLENTYHLHLEYNIKRCYSND